MCGIIGVLCQENKANQRAIDALHQLQNRGYDSAGVLCFNQDQEHQLHRAILDDTSALEKLPSAVASRCCIGHTRWATHGPKTIINAHPHLDQTERIAIVHNGIIENYMELRESLPEHKFFSETDSEVIAALIADKVLKGEEIFVAIRETLNQLRGTWGLVVVDLHDPSRIYCTRKGSPLLIGKTSKCAFVTSEQSGFCGQVVSYVALDDDDICTLSTVGDLVSVSTKLKDWKQYEQLESCMSAAELVLSSKFFHWMQKEIIEQEESIFRTLGMGGRIANNKVSLGGLDSHSRLANADHIMILACGTSRHAAMVAKHYFVQVCNFTTVQVYDASEFNPSDMPRRGKIVCIVVSQSGETRDVSKWLPRLRELDVPTIGVINVVGSQIARDVDCGVYCNAGREVAVASTKSFTSQTVALILIALWFSQKQSCHECRRLRIIESLRRLPGDVGIILNMWDKIESVAKKLIQKDSCFVLGQGICYPIALEGALKLKEISGIHAEGSPAGSLKHGPFGLLSSTFPVILIKIGEMGLLDSVEHEVSSRNAPIYVVSTKPGADIRIPDSECFSPLLVAVVFQMLSYKTSVLSGLDPDYPRNLAKVVTTD